MRPQEKYTDRALLTDVFAARMAGLVTPEGSIDLGTLKYRAKQPKGTVSPALRALCQRLVRNLEYVRPLAKHCAEQGWFRRGVVLVMGKDRYMVGG